MAKVVCPYCSRMLTVESQTAPATCDGCERQFDPTKVRFERATLKKRLAGWFLIAVGMLSLLGGLSEAIRYDFQDYDIVMTLIFTFLPPIIAIFVGLSLKRGSLVVEGKPPDPDLNSVDA